jgi:hypothetical protein
MQFKAYLERSKSVPLEVQLDSPYSTMLGSLVPHISRLAALAIPVNYPSDFARIVQHLRNPIPTLHKFTISSTILTSKPKALEIPVGINNDCFMYVKELQLVDFSSFRAPRAFPHLTKLTWYAGAGHSGPIELSRLLDTLEQLPVLEQIYLVFRTNQYAVIDQPTRMVTLPHVHQMSLRCSEDRKVEVGIPRILGFLKLPKLTSLVVNAVPELPRGLPTLPVASFDEHLPNLAELPEMEVRTRGEIGQVRFRSPSQAVLEYRVVAQPLGEIAYRHDRRNWGGLPLHSVRRLTAALDRRAKVVEDVWLIRLLRDLGSLEHLEFEGNCGGTLRLLRRLTMLGKILLGIKTLTVRSGTYDIRQAMRLKDVTDGLGLEVIVTCIPGPEVSDIEGWSPDADGLSEGWDMSDEDESDDGLW